MQRLREETEAVSREPGRELDRDEDDGREDRDERGTALRAHSESVSRVRRRRGSAAPLTNANGRTGLPEKPTNASAGGASPERKAKRARDYKLPRSACSRSIDSKSALKLPSPKVVAPWRSITSKKSVGRSCAVFVKIWSRSPSSSRSARIRSRRRSSYDSSIEPTRPATSS